MTQIDEEAKLPSSVFKQNVGDLYVWKDLQYGCSLAISELEEVLSKYKELHRNISLLATIEEQVSNIVFSLSRNYIHRRTQTLHSHNSSVNSDLIQSFSH